MPFMSLGILLPACVWCQRGGDQGLSWFERAWFDAEQFEPRSRWGTKVRISPALSRHAPLQLLHARVSVHGPNCECRKRSGLEYFRVGP